MISDIFFCFGPGKGAYLIDTKKTLKHNGMPENMINSIGNDKVQKICTVAVQKDRGNFMCYVDRSGNSWTRSSTALKESCSDLQEWLERRRAKNCQKQLSVTFGTTNITYAACAPCCNATASWNVSDCCKEAMRSYTPVQHVALGAGSAYVLLYGEGGLHWNLAGNYEALNKILSNKGGSKVTFVALNPWGPEQFFLVLDNDTAYFQVDASLETPIRNVLKNEGISCHALQPSSSSREVSTARYKMEKIKDKSFLKSFLGATVGGVVSHVIVGLVTGAMACTVM